MQYGFFDDKRKEYVIETPATPMPWINYLGSQEFFSLISNTAGGYCFYRDAKLQRILRYRYNNVPADVGGRFFYIKEEDKAPWSPTFHPVDRSLDSYRCRHGMGYTVFETEKDGLYAELTFLVPIGENCEVQRVRLTNRSAETKRFRFTAAVEWCLWNTVDDTTNFQRNLNIGELEVEGSAIYHKTEYRERRNHYAYYGVNAPHCGLRHRPGSFFGNLWDFCKTSGYSEWKDRQFCRPRRRTYGGTGAGCNPCTRRRKGICVCPRLWQKSQRPEIPDSRRHPQGYRLPGAEKVLHGYIR